MENIPRIHDVGHPRRDSKIDEKGYSVNLSIQRQNRLHVNDIVWGENGNTENVFRILLKFRKCSHVSLRSLVILGTWIREEMGRELF